MPPFQFVCSFGRWHGNIMEGDYTVWPLRGVEMRHKDGPDDPHPIVELVCNGVIGPPVGPGADGKPEPKGLADDKWKTMKIKGVYIVDRATAKISLSVN